MGLLSGAIGGIATIAASAAQAIMRAKAAKEQAKKAGDIRQSAKYVPKEQLRPEFGQVKNAQTIASNYGLNNISRYEQNIDNSVANMNRDATAIGSSGGASLAALSGAYGQSLNARNDLAIKDSEARQGKLNQLYGTTWSIGNEERNLELERNRKKELILAEANALDKASMANKMGATDAITNGVMQGAAMFAGSGAPNTTQKVRPQETSYQMPQQQSSSLYNYNAPNSIGGSYGMQLKPNGR